MDPEQDFRSHGDDPRPRHEQIAAELRAEIMDGTLRGKLPTTEELNLRFDTSNATITKVMSALRREELVTSRRGRDAATFAKDWAAREVDATAYLEPGEVIVYGKPEVGEVEAPGDVAQILGEQRAIMRRRTTFSGKQRQPTEVSTSYIAIELARRLKLDFPGKIRGGMRRVFDDAGMPERRFIDVISARQPTSAELLELAMPPGVPVLRILRTIMTDADLVLHVDVICKGAHRFHERYPVEID